MNEVINYVSELLSQTLKAVGISLMHNWKILAFAILTAVILKTYVNSDKLSQLLFKRKKISILASVAFGAFTPLCACGTTAVIIGMLTTTFPWGPIMAFLTSSPLMSPDGFVMISGIIGLKFAVGLTIASVVIGLSSGFITNIIEKKTNFLAGQSRFAGKEQAPACSCNSASEESAPAITTGCACGTLAVSAEVSQDKAIKKDGVTVAKKFKLKEFAENLYTLGFRQILLFYTIFIAIGFMINYFIPSSIISALFGANAFYAVPLASIIGLPLYITTDSGIPIIQSMLQSGASEGAMMAFMITGSATSAWVIAGLSTFLKKRAIMLYVAFVMVGGILTGYLFDFINLFL
jgi:uncharacterized membrane protein YraQ (UPF0718 family)